MMWSPWVACRWAQTRSHTSQNKWRVSPLSPACPCCERDDPMPKTMGGSRITTWKCKLIYALEWVSEVHAGSSRAAPHHNCTRFVCMRARERQRRRCSRGELRMCKHTTWGARRGALVFACACEMRRLCLTRWFSGTYLNKGTGFHWKDQS